MFIHESGLYLYLHVTLVMLSHEQLSAVFELSKITGGLGVETLANVPPGEQKKDRHSDDVTYDSSYYTIY
jgi:hypothetical protein